MERVILHCDCNSFYASVEMALNENLRNVPMAVAGNPENRHGIILAKNELAKKYGIKTGESNYSALNKCKDLVLVLPNYKKYSEYSNRVNDIYKNFTDLIEPFGIDESWLDVTGTTHIFGTGAEIADKIRKKVKDDFGITVSVGVSFNKIFAKLGSDYKKPDATTVISKENYKQIVYPLPVSDLLYVGKSISDTLSKMYINTIGDLANAEKSIIAKRLGKAGELIWQYANGLDNSRVQPYENKNAVKSVGNGSTFKRDLLGINDIKPAVYSLSNEVAYRMRKQSLFATVITVSIKNQSFKTISRRRTLSSPTNSETKISKTVIELIKETPFINVPIRALTITASMLTASCQQTIQLSMFDETVKDEDDIKIKQIENTLEELRDKYGKNIVTKASIVNNDLGIE